MAKPKVNRSNVRKLSARTSAILDAMFNSKPAKGLPKGFKFNESKIVLAIRHTLMSNDVQSAIRKLINTQLSTLEKDYASELEKMMIGRGTEHRNISDAFIAQIRSSFKVSKRSQRTHNWIMTSTWGGDWYAYKRAMTRRRVVKTGKKDNHGKDIYNVYTGRLGRDDASLKKQDKSEYYMSVGQFKEGDSAKRYNKTIRSTRPNKNGKPGPGFVGPSGGESHVSEKGFTSRLNPDKVGKRAARATGQPESNIAKYEVARAVALAEQLRSGVQTTGGTAKPKRKNAMPRTKVPYAKTGKMAHALSRTFSFKTSGVKIEGVTVASGIRKNTVNISIKGNLNIPGMAADYKRNYLRTPVLYRRLLVNSSENLFDAMVLERLSKKKS